MNRLIALLLGLALASLTACSSRSGSYTQIAQELLASGDAQNYPRTAAEVEAYPYAQMGVRLGKARPGIAVLAEYEQGNHRWVAADSVSILTSPDGQLLEMRSTDGVTVSSIPLAREQPLVELVGTPYQRVVVSSVTGERVLRCQLESVGETELPNIDVAVAVKAFRERCADTAGQSERLIYFDNRGRFRGLEGPWYPGAQNMRLDVLKVPA